MLEIGSYEAKTKLPELLRRVEGGESFTITNRGKPVADIVPSRAMQDRTTEAAVDSILRAKKRVVSDLVLSDLKEDGRKRWRSS